MDLSNLAVLKKSRVVHVIFAITFFTTGIIINAVQCVLYLTLRNLDKNVYRKVNWYLDYMIYSLLVFMGDYWSNSKVRVYADKEDFDKHFGKEHAFCIMNHAYEVDWLLGWMLTDRLSLLGNCKCYCKKVIQYLPVLGWAWKFSEFVFLERNFEKDKENIHRQVQCLAEHPDPMWLLMFPEGTRFTEKKHEASVEFARANNLECPKHHLLPRTKGFIASLPAMHGKVPAVYDILLCFDPKDPIEPTMTNLLNGESVTGHLYMHRIPLEDVPKSAEGQDKFLKDMFFRKDKMKDSFLKTGDFFKESGIKRVDSFILPRRIGCLINMVFWGILTQSYILYLLLKLLFSGVWSYFFIGVGIIGIFVFLLNKTIAMSETKKGSSYGINSTPKKSN